MSKQLADIICRALIAIVVGIRKEYGLPDYKNVVLIIETREDLQFASDVLQTINETKL
jgi:hypothetical protein